MKKLVMLTILDGYGLDNKEGGSIYKAKNLI